MLGTLASCALRSNFVRCSVVFVAQLQGASRSIALTYPCRCIQPKRVKTAQSIRVDWDLPGIDPSSSPSAASESIIDRFSRITSEQLNFYKGLKFNAPLNNVVFATLNCSGPDFPTGVDSAAVEGGGELSLSRSLCLTHLNDADASTRTSLRFPTSDTTDIPTNPQRIAVPSSTCHMRPHSSFTHPAIAGDVGPGSTIVFYFLLLFFCN
jgi:hypothetical protein